MSWWAFGISMAMTAISTDITVRSSRAAAKATEKAAFLNANEKRIQAQQAMDVAAENARRKQTENRRQLAAVRAATAANGFQMEGTPLAVLGDTALQLEQEILDISYDAETRRRALLAGAEMDIWEGANKASALRTEATASAVQGMASAAGSYVNASGMGASSSPYLAADGAKRPDGSPKGF
ncbi:hypothetical protein [Luteolibacter luteus]|uniref:Internal virion protein n=1 Tax=Luteolibacter luteus TaxID=2728835 RepID=A0A858RRG4_9BACT|nr:hypothetical protein [Luteolibacter luteus]QJE99134.1 hypothetical protein HHL09_26255 [Luteolibacter luteus]